MRCPITNAPAPGDVVRVSGKPALVIERLPAKRSTVCLVAATRPRCPACDALLALVMSDWCCVACGQLADEALLNGSNGTA